MFPAGVADRPVDHREDHVVAVGGVHQMREGVVERRRPGQVGRDPDHVGALTLPEGSEPVETGRASAALRRHLQYGRRREPRGVPGVDLTEEARLSHLGEGVERVVTRGAVVAERDRNLPVEVVLDRRDPRGEFHVRGGAVGDDRVRLGEHLPFALVRVDAVRERHVRAGDPDLVEPEHVPPAGVGLHRLDLVLVLAGVGVDRHAVVPVGQLATAAQARLGTGDREPRRDRVPDASVGRAVVLPNEGLALRERRVGLLQEAVRRVAVHQHLPEPGADPGVDRGLERLRGVVHGEVVDDGRRPRFETLQVAQLRGRPRRLGVHRRLHRQHGVEQPVQQRGVVSDPPAQRLDGVNVAADEPRRDDVELAALVVGVPLAEVGLVADRGDRFPLDDDSAVGDDGLRVGDDCSGDQHVRPFLSVGP
ncbi:hypothetical protein BN903_60 [Halorubrum sp. AJ67]|nr:hypothetical protein BN903_60 [Halorubrum sp. AJ67]